MQSLDFFLYVCSTLAEGEIISVQSHFNRDTYTHTTGHAKSLFVVHNTYIGSLVSLNIRHGIFIHFSPLNPLGVFRIQEGVCIIGRYVHKIF